MADKKTVFIIGAGKGLGISLAKKFGSEGFRVVLMARDLSSLQCIARKLSQAGIEAYVQQTDVANDASFARDYEEAVQSFGTPDAVLYNVGVTAPDTEETKTPQVLLERYQVDVAGAYNCVLQADTPDFAAKGGAILITGGGIAFHPNAAYLPLSMDKAALRAMVLALAPGLAEKGIYLGTVQVSGTIGSNDFFDPDRIAQVYWQMYTERREVETIYKMPS